MVLSMDRWIGKVAIVTGASSGIGAAIAEELVKKGLINIDSYQFDVTRSKKSMFPTKLDSPLILCRPSFSGHSRCYGEVVGLARRVELVEALAQKLSKENGKLHGIKTDVSKEEDILSAFAWIKKNLGPIHVLVNNAGTAVFGLLTETPTETYKKVLDLNVLGLCICTREAVKNMRENNIKGHIFHMNSISGHTVIPGVTAINLYSPSKFAVTALTETLRQELNQLKTNIKITSISPGLVETEMVTDNSSMPKEMIEILKKSPSLKGEDIADAVIYALSTPEHVQVHELTIKPVGEIY